MTCEDAPCCGCCGASLYGSDQGGYDGYDDYDPYDEDADEMLDPSQCKHDGGNYSYSEDTGESECDDCGTDGVNFPFMGEYVHRFPVTFYGGDNFCCREDRGLEGGLFGDC